MAFDGFEVGEQAQRFQHLVFQVLRFVYHDDEAMALLRDLQQALVELVVHLHQVLRVLFAAQLGEQQAHELLRVAMGLKQECDARRGAEGFQQVEQHGGLAHAGLSDQTDESAIGFDTVVQGSERFLMGLAEIKKARVRSNAERLFAQSKKIQVHGLLRLTSPFPL